MHNKNMRIQLQRKKFNVLFPLQCDTDGPFKAVDLGSGGQPAGSGPLTLNSTLL